MSGDARVALLPGQDTPARLAVTLSLAGFAGAVLLNLQQIAWWVTPLALAIGVWRARASWSTHRLPPRPQRMLLVIVLTVATVVSLAHGLNDLGVGATMLTAMAAAKLTETRNTRDWGIIIGTTFFLLVTACLDAQALWRLPLYGAEAWLLCTALRALGGGSHADARRLAMQSGRALAWSLPLALLLFLFFPRLQGGFWALPRTADAVTGLGLEMSPGSISQLSESDEPALRVRFDGPLPPPAERYWRGPVLHNFDGYTWSRGLGQAQTRSKATLQFSGPAYAYDVTMEPAIHNVLIALELPSGPGSAGESTQYSGDYQLLSTRPLAQARSYHLLSYTAHRDDAPLDEGLRRADLRLGAQRNLRAQALGRQLRAAAAGDAAFVAAALSWLRQGHFEYTLTPPLLSLDSVDDFLFGTRQGFCGHFASSFVTLMRAGGVPARVVTGYLGGEWNPVGKYLLLRQSHAHAWAEVWLDGSGWTRVDPTVAVAPERLTRDVFEFMGDAGHSAARALRNTPWLGAFIQSAEALNAWWQDSVVGFDYRRQLGILQKLGFQERDWRAVAMLVGGGASLWLGWVAWGLRDRLRPLRHDALARLWLQVERHLARHGGARLPHEGPLAYAQRIAAVRPALAVPLQSIARQYADLRYGPESDETARALAALRAQVRRFGALQAP